MTVLIVERITPSLRGELTRWMIQPHSSTYVGRLSARVRDLLWQRVERSVRDGAAILIYSTDTEQGFGIRTIGDTRRLVVDFEGLILAKMPIPFK
jgi:CRISPR-associated protein Cas2